LDSQASNDVHEALDSDDKAISRGDLCMTTTSSQTAGDRNEQQVMPLHLAATSSSFSGQKTLDDLRDSLVRCIRADELLHWFGRLLRVDEGDIYHLSKPTESIHDFMSHSWHAPAWGKICTLTLYYKGKAMAAAGCKSAAAGALAWPVGALDSGPELAGLASITCGMLGMLAVMVWWPCKGTVFLDKACIKQGDDVAKRRGIMHLGVILRHSRNMVVLWDSTYFSRLWCAFEIAARVKIAEQAEEGFGGLTVIPSIYGGIAVTGCVGNFVEITMARSFTIAMSGSSATPAKDYALEDAIRSGVVVAVAAFLVFTPLAPGIHRQMRSITQTTKQLEAFSIKNAECFCCAHNHRHPETGVKLPCDRKPIEASVKQWFGSMEEFDHHVPKLVQPYIVNTAIVPYHYVVFVAFPDLFEAMGIFSWWVHSGKTMDGLYMVCYKLMTAFVYLPFCCFFVMQLYSLIPDHHNQGVLVRSVTMTVTTAAIAAMCGIVSLGERLALVFLGPWYGLLPVVIVYGVPVFLIYHRYAYSQKSYANLRPRLTLGAALG